MTTHTSNEDTKYYSHFVVMFDHQTGEFILDDDTGLAHFDDGMICGDSGNWYDDEDESLPKIVSRLDFTAWVTLRRELKNLKSMTIKDIEDTDES